MNTLHWKQIAALSGNCVKEIDRNGNIVAVNDRCREVLEAADESELLGKSWRDLWPESLWPEIEGAIDAARRGEVGRFSGEATTLRGRKRYWDVMVACGPEGSDPDNLLVMRHDVTLHREATKAQQTLNAALRKQIGMQQLNAEEVEMRYARLTERLQGEQSHDYVAQLSIDALRGQLASSEKNLDLAQAASLIADGVSQNVQKEQAISHLIAGLAHDFNNMLSTTIMSLSICRESELTAKQAELIKFALESSEQAGTLAKRLMSFSRRYTIEPREIDLGKVVSDIFSFAAHSLGARYPLELQKDAKRYPTFADPHMVEQAFINLCLNARDASKEGAKIVIRLDELAIGASEGSLARPQGHFVTLSVIDHGTGMTPEVQEHLFEPYFTTKAAGRGTGLGLAQVYGLMKQVGGFVSVESRQGVGTTVHLAFPRAHPMILSNPDCP